MRAERERPTLLAQTVYLGTLGLVFVLPVIVGAYLGSLAGQPCWRVTPCAGP